MRAVLQRVNQAAVVVEGETVGQIGRGLLVYVGVSKIDTPAHANKLAHKVANQRIFPDLADKLNRSVVDIDGGILVIPNFTLQACAKKGLRPSFDAAAPGEIAKPLQDAFLAALGEIAPRVETGVFGADMQITSTADGPINLIIDVEA